MDANYSFSEEKRKAARRGTIAFIVEGLIILVIIIVVVIIFKSGILTNSNKSSKTIKPVPTLSQTVFQNRVSQSDAQENIEVITKNKAWHYAEFNYEFEGKILQIDTNGGTDETLNTPYKVRLIVGLGKGTDKTVVLFSLESMSKLKIVDSAKNSLAITDLKVGDRVVIAANTSTLRKYPNSLNSAKITKLN